MAQTAAKAPRAIIRAVMVSFPIVAIFRVVGRDITTVSTTGEGKMVPVTIDDLFEIEWPSPL
jgi:hypothetical protein